MPPITHVSARQVLNSRAAWTIEVLCVCEGGALGRASVPEGKSKGSLEAPSLTPYDAVRAVESVVAPRLIGRAFSSIRDLEALLLADSGGDKLGASVILGVSLSYARACAQARHRELWEVLSSEFGTVPGMPRLYANMINGGLHAGNGLPFQEYLVIPPSGTAYAQTVAIEEFYHALAQVLTERKGAQATLVGDEGGFAPLCDSPLDPFVFFTAANQHTQYAGHYVYGLDAAASNCSLQPARLQELYREMATWYPFVYLEDPLDEHEVDGVRDIVEMLPHEVVVTGDDSTVTDAERIVLMATRGGIGGVIIKPNQAGSLTKTFTAIEAARAQKLDVVVSHRSGETEDPWIADLAYACGADGFKLGAPARGERTAKYNRLLEIER